MRLPALSFLYRLQCQVAKEEINIGAPHGAGTIRSIANIVEGTLKGPDIEATVLPLGGADWATVIEGTHVRRTASAQWKQCSVLTCSSQ
jgi:hypothetical protein